MSRKAFVGDTLKYPEATFQALLKKPTAGGVQHFKPILKFSSPHKGVEGCLPCHPFQHLDSFTQAAWSARTRPRTIPHNLHSCSTVYSSGPSKRSGSLSHPEHAQTCSVQGPNRAPLDRRASRMLRETSRHFLDCLKSPLRWCKR